ncbi:MAG: SpoIIE family protein phosphatase [Planctomycetia bacterium]|nr:SpoIIE family protein phosphatase [Planctomycetia bacterium]
MFLAFLVYDYGNDSADRLELNLRALDEQARILMPAVLNSTGSETSRLQDYLADTHRRMEATHPDEHMVAVDANGRFTQIGVSLQEEERVAAELREISTTGSRFVEIEGQAYLVGLYHEATTIVYVAEDLRDVRAAIRADLKRHVVGVAVALLCGVLVINCVLWLAFHRPLATLTHAVAKIGSGKLGLQIDRIGTTEFDVLATAINGMSHSLAEADRAQAAQMRKARTIQRHLLPARMQLEGFTIAHHFEPADSIGGDYYDLFPLEDGSGLFCIADVTGHGVSAALVVAIVKTILINAVERCGDPGEVMAEVNRRLNAMDIPDIFVSMALVRLRPGCKELEYAGAGHPPALIIGPDSSVRKLESMGPLLGIGIDFEWTTERTPFAREDRLLLFTDGVTETSSPVQGLFNLSRLQEVALASRRGSPAEGVEAIVTQLAEYRASCPPDDDVTLMLIDSNCDGARNSA